ncbi:hypothetical protein F0562_019985 [Nyssa sinensis]|uniref:Lipoxygenase n=1 Tax=Nyssa sinensis TaxID=561372 RepID=A0A5J5BRB4_9ASTE|nr:hypothetical protein F0562_019985 [Nyssa sinensis]
MSLHLLDKAIKGIKGEKKVKIKGNVVLMKKNAFALPDVPGAVLDSVHELLGQKVSLQLISAVNGDPEKGMPAKLGKVAYLKKELVPKDLKDLLIAIKPNDSNFRVTFEWDEELGVPGAFIIKNCLNTEFYLKTLTLEDVPGYGELHFVCNSWVYPQGKYRTDRIFFSNQAYLPSETPAPLRLYREKELMNLRGDGTGELEEWDRVYDYDYYNDLGSKDAGHVLGGSTFPYPRRGRTGWLPAQKNGPSEILQLLDFTRRKVYVPRDEQFNHVKMPAFFAHSVKSQGHLVKSQSRLFLPSLWAVCNNSTDEFESFQEVLKLYEVGFEIPLIENIMQCIPSEFVKELAPKNGEAHFQFPMPQVIKEDKHAWRTDEEFAREMLAGVNPVIICRLPEFPPTSKLDPKDYGNQTSSITREHIENNDLEGLSIDEAMENNRLFILDYHDALMPYLRKINSTSTKTYATRTLLFLTKDGILKPLAIELSLPHPEKEEFGAISKVYTPAKYGVEGSIWQLAKAYVSVNDYGYHQLISHWLNTHAVIEPFVIAMNRQLSVVHPIYKLLHPHFRDTMCINAFARRTLINAGGIFEKLFFPGKFAMEFSSMIYKSWAFPEQALPVDLIKRGIAVEDSNSPHGLRLLIEDYPYAVDGLQIWSAIKTWVQDYCSCYYKTNEMVQTDTELQSWWKELREKGHGDKKDEAWWPKMQTLEELIEACTIIIWMASALHAAVNFGQYPYAGYFPNRPTMSRRFLPEPGTFEYQELEQNPEKVFLRTITAKPFALEAVSLIEILSRHSPDEVYLGQRDDDHKWTRDTRALEAFKKFGDKLVEIEKRIKEMNRLEHKWKNRVGPVKMPYTLLSPIKGKDLDMGIPNSISI